MKKLAQRIGKLWGRTVKGLSLRQKPIFYGNICIRCGCHVVKHLLNDGKCLLICPEGLGVKEKHTPKVFRPGD